MIIKLNYPKFWLSKNLTSSILIPFSWVYRIFGIIRQLLSVQQKLPGKVICIGNMSVGGTGKTQMVIWLAMLLKNLGVNYVIVTKGYGSKLKSAVIVDNNDNAREVGDESILLSQYGNVIASPKVTNAIPLLKSLKPDVILVDDGMQNPHFYKDFTILTIDPLRGAGNNLLIPAGPLRELPNNAIYKADLILMLGNKSCKDESLLNEISNSKKPFYQGEIVSITDIDKTKKYIAFTGIGNPDKFFSLLKKYAINVVEEISYPDHYNYQTKDLLKLSERAQNNGFNLITTKKDYIKIAPNYNIQYLDIKFHFKNEREIIALLNEKILKKI